MARVPRHLLENLEKARETLRTGKRSKAAVFARKAYAAAADLPVGHPARMEAARTLGLLLLDLNQRDEGARLLRESGDLAQADTPVDPSTEEELRLQVNEISLRLQSGKIEGTEQADLLLARARRLVAEGSEGLVRCLSCAGQVHENSGSMRTAERLFREALEMQERAGGRDDVLVPLLLDVGRILLRTERHRQAAPFYRKALQIQERREAPEQADMAVTLNQLAFICDALGETREATEHLERGLRIRQETLGADHPQVTLALHGIAAMHLKAGRHDEADEVFERALLILERSAGESDPRSIQFLVERGLNRIAQKRMDIGLALVEQARQRAQTFPSDHPLRLRLDRLVRELSSLTGFDDLHRATES